MKFEHVLRIYWRNYFMYNSRALLLTCSLREFISTFEGLGRAMETFLIYRFELIKFFFNAKISFSNFSWFILGGINRLLSRISSINNYVSELRMWSILRLYLLKTTRGKGHILGKPVHGQRTWSNAWSAYKTNTLLRTFINKLYEQLDKNKREVKIDYTRAVKKVRHKNRKKKDKIPKFPFIWF